MNFGLSDEQELLREAARGALSRHKTIEAAREALDGGELPDLWPTAVNQGWPGLLISEDSGGAGLGALDAMLVFGELGRVLAGVPLLGHVAASFVLDGAADDELLARLASGEQRAALVPARPPDDVETRWTVDRRLGSARAAAPAVDGSGRLSGEVPWVVDAPGADWLVVIADGGRAVLVDAAAVEIETVRRYDPTRSLGHVQLDGVHGTVLEIPEGRAEAAWYLIQMLLGAESVGAVEHALEMSVAYAKERFTFGRAIGSYQAVKHALVEMLRRLDNARSLMLYAGWAAQDEPAELAVAASAFRFSAGEAMEVTARSNLAVHGGIGATWEHDAPLFFRRAQLGRRLLGGTADGAERVAAELFAVARAG
jgi:alkylation response protein AidB-like acyl-CoA dehydrogenase